MAEKNIQNDWIEVCYWAYPNEVEIAQNAFWHIGAQGIVLDDGEEPDKNFNLPNKILIKAYFISEANLKEKIFSGLSDYLSNFDLSPGDFSLTKIPPTDWQEGFRKTCTTFKVEPNIYIVPSFEIENFLQNPKGDLYIEMDPENAFGTGHHQTTKLCLTALYNYLTSQKDIKNIKVLDIGTGSAILAILMAKMGVNSILGTDTDGDAIITAKQNAQKNNTNINLIAVDENHIYKKNHYDLIVANILSEVLIQMVKNISEALKPNGVVFLSGILSSQKEKVIKAYEDFNFALQKSLTMDDWCLLQFVKLRA